ncbi:uncharacterized protein LOC132729285 [Ruditapes philippinarum]|uniref:uncharacterized protein LOC132729285 n=1 Tax=Ruditapes philippinarum TaxID=129788 RepID=UPI00295B74C5|nr:uncharacterized protein LOC132729285 [Ruditapes philippinarum]
MSIKLVCKPEFFESRLNSHLGLNVTTEPGTTYFLCNDIEEVPSLVDPASLSFLSGEKKVQILVCKHVPNESKVQGQVVAPEKNKLTEVLMGNSTPNATRVIKEEKIENVIKTSSQCIVTDTCEKDTKKQGENRLATEIKVEAPVVNAPLYQLSNVKLESPVVMQGISAHIPPTLIPNKVQMRSSTADTCNVPSLPCQSLRQELKQAILQRRLVQGKTMIDLTKEENERKAVLQSIKMSEEEVERMLKRRVSNNRAARKCREKRKIVEENLMQEAKRLKARTKTLNEIISTLEQQQKDLRLYVTGAKSGDKDSNEKIFSILNSEIKIPDLPPRTMTRYDYDLSSSVILSSSEYNSDDTRNGFELDSSQETNDTRDSTSVSFLNVKDEMINQTVPGGTVSATKHIQVESDIRNFKEIDDRREQVDSDDDSDVELIEFDRPLVIDVN